LRRIGEGRGSVRPAGFTAAVFRTDARRTSAKGVS
jgi:hypothetical protein